MNLWPRRQSDHEELSPAEAAEFGWNADTHGVSRLKPANEEYIDTTATHALPPPPAPPPRHRAQGHTRSADHPKNADPLDETGTEAALAWLRHHKGLTTALGGVAAITMLAASWQFVERTEDGREASFAQAVVAGKHFLACESKAQMSEADNGPIVTIRTWVDEEAQAAFNRRHDGLLWHDSVRRIVTEDERLVPGASANLTETSKTITIDGHEGAQVLPFQAYGDKQGEWDAVVIRAVVSEEVAPDETALRSLRFVVDGGKRFVHSDGSSVQSPINNILCTPLN